MVIYDISSPTPVLKQASPIRSRTYNGIAFDPTGLAFYVAGGPDDVMQIITLNTSTGLWGETGNTPRALGHGPVGGLGLDIFSAGPVPVYEQVAVTPCAAGLAVASDGRTRVVANYNNDSITVFNTGLVGFNNWSKGVELDLRPGKNDSSQVGVPGGELPF